MAALSTPVPDGPHAGPRQFVGGPIRSGPILGVPRPFVGGPGPIVQGPGPLVGGQGPFIGGPGPIVGSRPFNNGPIIGGPGPIIGGPGPLIGGPRPIINGPGPLLNGPGPIVGGPILSGPGPLVGGPNYAPAPVYAPAPTPAYAPRPAYGEPVYENGPAVYSFNYGVKDDYAGLNFGHNEDRDGYKTQGTYYVNLPDGRLQTVNYHADEHTGYVADVQYTGNAVVPAYAPAPRPAYGPQ